MGWIITLCWLIAALGVVYKWRPVEAEPVRKKWWVMALFVRIMAGYALMAVYILYYPDRSEGDTWKYFSDVSTIRSWWSTNPEVVLRFVTGVGINLPEMASWKDRLIGWNTAHTYGLPYDQHTMVRLHLILSLLSFGYYEVHVLFSAIMGFIGSRALFLAFRKYFAQREIWLFLAVCLTPSLVFWSSGVLKEAPSWMALGLFLLSFTRLLENQKKASSWFLLLISTLLMISFKPYLAICLIPSLLALLFWQLMHKKHLVWAFVLSHSLIAILALNARWFNDSGDLMYLLHKKRTDFYHVAEESKSGSTVLLPDIDHTSDLIVHFPEAFFITYLRPLPGEATSLMMQMVAAENLIYILLIGIFLIRLQHIRRESLPLILLCISFISISAIIIGNTVPVLGAVARYRIAPLTFLVILCLLPDSRGIRNTISGWLACLKRAEREEPRGKKLPQAPQRTGAS